MTEQQELLGDAEIARHATRGAATYVLRTGASQAIQAISSLAVARILEPTDYGVFALALTLVAAFRMFRDLGITYSLIVKRTVADSDLRIAVTVALAVGVIGLAGITLVWPHLTLVRQAGHSAVWLGPALATTILIAVPADPSTVVMERDLKFGRLGLIGVVQALSLFGTQVILLLAGVGVWSMVIAQIVGATVGTVLTVRASRRLFAPSFRGPIWRMVREGLPYGAAAWSTTLSGTVTNLIVAAQLGARGIGLFAWCTILATPITGALAAVHSVSAPTLARMLRDDGSRYGESVGVVTRTMASTAAVSAGCLIGMASPTIRYVFGERWLSATSAVQFCLAGLIPTAILSVLASDANARQMRRASLVAALVSGAATLVTLWPLSALDGVGGASAADNCVGPIAGIAVFCWALRPPLTGALVTTLRLFVPLLVISFTLSSLVHTPLEFAGACAVTGLAGAGWACVAEGALLRRLVRVLRDRASPVPAIDTVSSDGAVLP